MIHPAVGSPIFPLTDQDRSGFTCGIEELDRYLHSQASQDARRKVAAPFVLLDSQGRIAGYYTLSSYGVKPTELPFELAKKLPRYSLLPVTLLGRLAVSRNHQGQKLGRVLLIDALRRSWRNSSEIGLVGVVAEAYNEEARTFYLHHEFIPSSDNPRKLFMAMKDIEKAFK